jgi:transcriptional regulator with XRE-family HTH domain
MSTPGERLKAAREANGYATAKEAAEAMGVPVPTYTQHERAPKFLPSRRAEQYARFYGLTPEFLLYGREDAIRDRVPVVNACGEPTGETVAIPQAPSAITRALAVTDGLHRQLAIYDQPQVKALPTDICGRLCIVQLKAFKAQQRLMGIVMPSAMLERFHLLSLNNQPPLFDQEIVWAARVVALIPDRIVTAQFATLES